MGKHSNRADHQAGHQRCTGAAIIGRPHAPTIPMTIALAAPPDNIVEAEPWSDWTPPDTWLKQHGHTALAVIA